LPGSADAAVCTGGTLTTPCTMLGTATLTGGVLTLTSPASINGTAQSVVDALPTDSRRAPHRHRLLSERLVGQHPGERRHRGLHLDHHDDHCLGAMMRGCC